MKKTLLALIFLAGCAVPSFAGGVAIGIGYARFPVPPPPPPVYAAPPYPGPGYTWVAGYYYPVGPRYAWRPGYWVRPPFARAYWIAPRFHGHLYYRGYWRR